MRCRLMFLRLKGPLGMTPTSSSSLGHGAALPGLGGWSRECEQQTSYQDIALNAQTSARPERDVERCGVEVGQVRSTV